MVFIIKFVVMEIVITPDNVEKLTKEQIKIILNSEKARTIIREIFDNEKKVKEGKNKVSEETTLLNKTRNEKEREWMQATIDLLKAKNMWTAENIEMLMNNVSYGVENGNEYIQVWPTKRDTKDFKKEADDKNIFQHNGFSYFVRSQKMIAECNSQLGKQNMRLPSDDHFNNSLEALPGYKKEPLYDWWNILALITGMSMAGYQKVNGEFAGENECGMYRSSSQFWDAAISYSFNKTWGSCNCGFQDFAYLFRAVLK